MEREKHSQEENDVQYVLRKTESKTEKGIHLLNIGRKMGCASIVILKPYQAKDSVNTTTKRFVNNLPKSGREVMPTGNNKTI